MMRFLSKILGLWLIAVALVAAVLDGTRSIAAATWTTKALGQYWFDLAPASLNTAQAAIQRHVNPYLWDPVIFWLLQRPVWLVVAPLGFLLLWLGERRRRRIRFPG